MNNLKNEHQTEDSSQRILTYFLPVDGHRILVLFSTHYYRLQERLFTVGFRGLCKIYLVLK